MPELTTGAPGSVSQQPLVESKTSGAAGEIFLSPHVVDETAFHDYAQRLRSLIAEAEDAAQALRGAMLEATTVNDQVLSRMAEQSRQLSAAAKVLRAFDAMRRISTVDHDGHERAQQSAEQAKSSQSISRVQRQIHVSVESALKELDRRAGAVIRSIEDRQIRLEARLDGLARKEQAITEMLRQIEDTTLRAQEQGRSLVALHCRTNDAIEKLETMIQTESNDSDGPAASSEASSA